MFCGDGIIYLISFLGALSLYLFRNGINNPKTHLSSFLFFLILTIINPLVSHNGVTVLFVINNSPITLEALIYGFFASILIISVLYWFRTFSQIMTSDKLLYIFDRFSPKLALIISMSLRYIPLFGRQIKKINQCVKALGSYNEENVIDKAKLYLKTFSAMVTWTIENGIITAESMDARGYGVGKRSRYSNYFFSFPDVIFILLTFVLFMFSVFLIRNKSFEFYPSFSVSFSDESIIGYVLYGIIAFVPLFIEVKEELKWKYLKLKI
ncbi:MAG: cobalt transport protein [Ruminococcaceae bacterium]|nr:cobalt transport protein [Oscillospiraceae bacterium]